MVKWKPHPLGRIVLHPEDEASELARLKRSELGPDYVLRTHVPPRPEKNTQMTPEWHAYFHKYQAPKTAVDMKAVAVLCGVSIGEVGKFFAPWLERRRELFELADIKTRVAIQAKRDVMHALGFMVQSPPDPWELENPPHVTRVDSIAIARAAKGERTDEEKAKEREARAAGVMGKLAKMRANLCGECQGVGGVADGAGELQKVCGVCEGKGVVAE